MAEQTAADDTDRIVRRIRAFAESIENPGRWRVEIPVASYDAVKEQLDTTKDLNTYYEGVVLCYSQQRDEPRVVYKADLAEHMEGA